MYKSYGLCVFLDISTYCNAACPQCHRTDPNGLGKANWLPLIQWDLETFKNAYNLDKPRVQYHSFEFCGTWGDPVMNKDLLEMVRYIIDNSNATITIDTNGSIRDEEWWWKLGSIAGERLRVYFAVDGIDQKMHSHYRRNTDLKKVLANMESLSHTLAEPKVRTIVFKHNEDYLDEIEKLVKSYGARYIAFTPSDRWQRGPVFNFTDEEGNKLQLEQSRILNVYKSRIG